MKTGLVLEGGGMRGAYTAGALSWFLKENIEFDYSVGISSGAQHLCNFLVKDSQYLYDIAVVIGAQEFEVGLKPLLREGNLVGYDRLFDYALKQLAPLDLTKLKANKKEAEVGIFDLKAGKTKWVNTHNIDEDYKILKAASLIPMAGKPVVIDNIKYIDAGVAYMIPIERSVEKKVDKHIVITTKPNDYVRPKTGFLTNLYFTLFYNRYKIFREKVKKRADIYYYQKDIINKLVKDEKALEIYPSKSFDIGRFGGDLNQLSALYQQGFDDCEKQRAEIYKFLELEDKNGA